MAGEGKHHWERLAQVIFWSRSFTAEELAGSFRRFQKGQGAEHVTRSMADHLEKLRELGVLRFHGGRYHLIKRELQPA